MEKWTQSYIPNQEAKECLLVRIAVAGKRHHVTATLIKKNIHSGLAHRLRDLVHYHHGGWHGSFQADVVLEKELGVLHLDPQLAEGDCVEYIF